MQIGVNCASSAKQIEIFGSSSSVEEKHDCLEIDSRDWLGFYLITHTHTHEEEYVQGWDVLENNKC